MGVIGHAMNGEQFLAFSANDAGDVFLEFFFVLRPDKILPSFYGEYDLNIDLRVGISHDHAAPNGAFFAKLFISITMSLLRSFGRRFVGFYKHAAPDGARTVWAVEFYKHVAPGGALTAGS